jgi:hypothetical protein
MNSPNPRVECVCTPTPRVTLRTIVVLVFILVLTVVATDRGLDGTMIASIVLAGGALLQAVTARGAFPLA